MLDLDMNTIISQCQSFVYVMTSFR